ncbi:MAG: alanine:cation symporter family protein [Clostridium sp.]
MKLLIDVNQLLWNGPILVMLFGTHVYFTLRLRLVQQKIGYGISLLFRWQQKQKGFGRFGSLTTTLAATLGTGNIIGISTAVFLGGPGAVFWCWLTGLLGMATTYAETFCATISAIRDTVDPCIFFIFTAQKRLHFFTVPRSRYLHFLSDAPHKATQ